jgi:hypothetical protein
VLANATAIGAVAIGIVVLAPTSSRGTPAASAGTPVSQAATVREFLHDACLEHDGAAACQSCSSAPPSWAAWAGSSSAWPTCGRCCRRGTRATG